MTHVLILGASGFLGSHLTTLLRNFGDFRITEQSRLQRHVSIDFTDNDAAYRQLSELNPDFIVNLIAKTDVDDCERNPGEAFFANALLICSLQKYLQNHKLCKLIQLSTDQVYDSDGMSVEDEVMPINMYGRSKLLGDLLALRSDAMVLRTNFFGPVVKGKNPSGLFEWIIGNMKAGSEILGFREIVFSPVNVFYLCEVISKCIKDHQKGVFNVGSNEPITKYDFCIEVSKLVGVPRGLVKSSRVPNGFFKARRPLNMGLDVSKIEDYFQIKMPNVRDQIQELKAYV